MKKKMGSCVKNIGFLALLLTFVLSGIVRAETKNTSKNEYLQIIETNPYEGDYWVDIYANIYIKFDRNIQEGSYGSGLGDILLLDQGFNPWGINSIIINGDILEIYPNQPLEYDMFYSLHIPSHAVADWEDANIMLEHDFYLSFKTDYELFEPPSISPYSQIFSLTEPTDIIFDIEWGTENGIQYLVHFYYDEFYNYYEETLVVDIDFAIEENQLIIFEEFILSVDPEPGDEVEFFLIFESGWMSFFYIDIVFTTVPSIYPEYAIYDLSNPGDVYSNIVFASAQEIINIYENGNLLAENADYEIIGNWIFIKEDYLSNVLQNINDEIVLDITFNTADQSQFTITAVETGITNATLDPQHFLVNENEMPEYVEMTITWNDANSVENLVVFFSEGGQIQSFDYPFYEVIPIDTETATLRLIFEEGGKNSESNQLQRAIEYFFVSIQVNFDIGGPAYFYLTITYEWFEVFADVMPWYAGWVDGAYSYGVGSEVTLEAMPNDYFSFVKFEFEGGVEVFENPYTFIMPSEDVYVTAHFLFDFPEVLSSNPFMGETNVNPNTDIYLYFNRNIQEGENNAFENIIFETTQGVQWPTNIYVHNENILVVDILETLDEFTTYQLIVPDFAVADADDITNIMQWEFFLMFETGVEEYFEPYIQPEMVLFSLQEPENVSFDIVWGSETEITEIVYYYWDSQNEYQENYLSIGDDYYISDNELVILQEFILNNNPGPGNEMNFYAIFGTGWHVNFGIEIIYTTKPFLSPVHLIYDISNPGNVFTNIVFNAAQSVTGVYDGNTQLVENEDYSLNYNWLYINNSFLSQMLTSEDDEIVLTVVFDTEDEVEITITAIESGVTNASIYPEYVEYHFMEMPEYVDIIVTWNDASDIDKILVTVNEQGYFEEFEYDNYELTEIDEATSNLRLFFGGKNTSYTFVSMKIVFDVGGPAYFNMMIIFQYFEIFASVVPEGAGEITGYHGYFFPGEDVSLEAHANPEFIFQNWRVDGIVVSAENPYSFFMPAEDLHIVAHFISEEEETYLIELNADPENAGTVTGQGLFVAGESVTINAVANQGWKFVNWTTTDQQVFAETAMYSFEMPEENLVLTANFVDISFVETEKTIEIEIYPNPFSDVININSAENISGITITKITGQIVLDQKLFGETTVNAEHLPAGFYLVIIETDQGYRSIRKMVKH